MSYTLHFRPEVEKDLLTGYLWYERKKSGLGEEFVKIFYTQVADISSNPFLFRKVHKEVRRTLLNRFPYAVYFQIDDDKIIVFGLFHCARNPNNLHSNLKSRSD